RAGLAVDPAIAERFLHRLVVGDLWPSGRLLPGDEPDAQRTLVVVAKPRTPVTSALELDHLVTHGAATVASSAAAAVNSCPSVGVTDGGGTSRRNHVAMNANSATNVATTKTGCSAAATASTYAVCARGGRWRTTAGLTVLGMVASGGSRAASWVRSPFEKI